MRKKARKMDYQTGRSPIEVLVAVNPPPSAPPARFFVSGELLPSLTMFLTVTPTHSCSATSLPQSHTRNLGVRFGIETNEADKEEQSRNEEELAPPDPDGRVNPIFA